MKTKVCLSEELGLWLYHYAEGRWWVGTVSDSDRFTMLHEATTAKEAVAWAHSAATSLDHYCYRLLTEPGYAERHLAAEDRP